MLPRTSVSSKVAADSTGFLVGLLPLYASRRCHFIGKGTFQQAIRQQPVPKYLSTDNDPLYRFHQWQANLRVLEVTEIKTVPGVPLSHPFVERLIGTIRRSAWTKRYFGRRRTW